MTRRAVVLFARTPEREAAAKRLPASAAARFERNIALWLQAAQSIGATPVIACETRFRFDGIAQAIARTYAAQRGGTFAERLCNVVDHVRGHRAILIAAIDAPPPTDLQQAFAALERGHVRAAIGPARDGGVNFIAFLEPPLDLLRSFTMRDRRIAQRCTEYFVRVYRSEVASDIDTVHDLVAICHHRRPVALRTHNQALPLISRAPPLGVRRLAAAFRTP